MNIAAASLPFIAAAIISTSCIFEKPPGDDFYRTMWKSDEIPLGPFEAKTLILEFLCYEAVRIQIDDGPDLYGTYAPDGATTVLNNLRAYFSPADGHILTGDDTINGTTGEGSITVTFIEAHRNGETLFLLWRVEDAVYPFTTTLYRLTDYED